MFYSKLQVLKLPSTKVTICDNGYTVHFTCAMLEPLAKGLFRIANEIKFD